jgi:hypothetical protein
MAEPMEKAHPRHFSIGAIFQLLVELDRRFQEGKEVTREVTRDILECLRHGNRLARCCPLNFQNFLRTYIALFQFVPLSPHLRSSLMGS